MSREFQLAEAIQKDIENLKMEDDYIEWKIDELVFLLMAKEETLGERIKRLRLKNGLTMKEVGDRLEPKANKGCISNWEHNRNKTNPKRLKQLAEIFDVSVGYLYNGSEDEE